MSIRISSSATAPTRSGVPSGSGPLTVFGRARYTTAAAWSSIFSFGSGSGEQLMQFDGAGTGIVVQPGDGSAASSVIFTPGTNKWFDFCYNYAGSAGALVGYAGYRGVAWSSASVTGSNVTLGTPQFYLGTNSSAQFFNGIMEDVRVWTVALTAIELAAERASPTPVRWKDLWAWWELKEPNPVDAAGNARPLTLPSGTKPFEVSGFPGLNSRMIPLLRRRASAGGGFFSRYYYEQRLGL